jgi:hypothetical protein
LAPKAEPRRSLWIDLHPFYNGAHQQRHLVRGQFGLTNRLFQALEGIPYEPGIDYDVVQPAVLGYDLRNLLLHQAEERSDFRNLFLNKYCGYTAIDQTGQEGLAVTQMLGYLALKPRALSP